MATVQDFEERIEKQKAELARLEGKKRELERKIRERDRKWRTQVLQAAGEIALSHCGCAWAELDLDGLDEYLSGHSGEMAGLLSVPGSTPEQAKERLDARKRPRGASKEAAKGEQAPGGGQVTEGTGNAAW